MDAEIAAAVAAVTGSLLSGGIVALLKHPEDVVLVGPTTKTVDSSHVHVASSAGRHGWTCDCGKHLHNYTVAIPAKDGDGRLCQCGKTGKAGLKEWA